MTTTKTQGFLQKIDPQMWLTLIGFVFTLGLIYGEFQQMKNQIQIFEEKQKLFDEDFENETKMVLEKFETLEEKLQLEIETVEQRLDKKIKTINTLEDKVFCGPSCVFTNVNNPRSDIVRKDEYKKTIVKKGASIGANSTIICGNTLGEYCFIAAGAVVTKDVPSYALMLGNPAKRVGWMSKAGGRLGPDLICPIDGSVYHQIGQDKIELKK